MSANALATVLRMPAPRINDVVWEKRALSVDTSLRLARYFRTTPKFSMNLQMAYGLKVAEMKKGDYINQEIVPYPV